VVARGMIPQNQHNDDPTNPTKGETGKCKICPSYVSPLWKDGFCFYHSPFHSVYYNLSKEFHKLGIPSHLPDVNDLENSSNWPEIFKECVSRLRDLKIAKNGGVVPHGLKGSIRKMHVVFDLDETLVSAHSNSYPEGCTKITIGRACILVRPFALEILRSLRDLGVLVYVLSCGDKGYVFPICTELSKLCPGSIINTATCRIENMKNERIIIKKHFKQILPPGVDIHDAIAVDNSRKVWHKSVRSQVMVVSDFKVDKTDVSGGPTVLMLILAQLTAVNSYFVKHSKKTVAEILANFNEWKEKNRIEKFALSFNYNDPQHPTWQEFSKLYEDKVVHEAIV